MRCIQLLGKREKKFSASKAERRGWGEEEEEKKKKKGTATRSSYGRVEVNYRRKEAGHR